MVLLKKFLVDESQMCSFNLLIIQCSEVRNNFIRNEVIFTVWFILSSGCISGGMSRSLRLAGTDADLLFIRTSRERSGTNDKKR